MSELERARRAAALARADMLYFAVVRIAIRPGLTLLLPQLAAELADVAVQLRGIIGELRGNDRVPALPDLSTIAGAPPA